MDGLYQTQRIKDLKDKMLSEPRYASIEQALIITKTYQENEDDPRIIQIAPMIIRTNILRLNRYTIENVTKIINALYKNTIGVPVI